MRTNARFFLKRFGDRIGLDLPYFVKNGFWVALRQVIGASSGLLLAVVFARLASQEVYGQYQFILSVLAVVSILSIPGLNASIVKSAADGNDGDYRDAVKISFLWSLLGIPALMIIGGYFYGIRQEHAVGISLMIASMLFPFFYAPNTWDSFLQGKSRFDISARFSIAQSIFNTIGTVGVLFFYKDNLLVIVFVYLLSYSFFNVYFYLKSFRFIENNKKDGDMARYGWFLTRISVLGMISGNLDKLLVGFFVGPASLAVYSVGTIFTRQIQNISKSFLWLSVPKQIRQGSISKSNYWRIFIISVIATMVFAASFRFIVPFLFTERYLESAMLSVLSILFYPIFIISILYRNQCIFNKKEKALMKESIITPVIMMLLTIVILPVFGIYGLAFLFGLQYFVGLLVLYILNESTRFAFLRKP